MIQNLKFFGLLCLSFVGIQNYCIKLYLYRNLLKILIQQFQFLFSKQKDILMTAVESIQSKTAGRWTKEQHEKFLYGLKLYGKNWKKIEDLIQTRTSTQIRSHAQKFFIKMKKVQGDDEQSFNNDNSSQQKSIQETITPPSQLKSLNDQKSSLSFYLDRIVKNYVIHHNEGKQFNFWNSLVDSPKVEKTKSCQILTVTNQQFGIKLKRNQSLNFQIDQSQQLQSPKRFTSQFSCFEQYQSEPCKKIKIN